MNSRRRAELQRKLSMGAVPRPPAGLGERIKSDIPKYLNAESERQRFSSSIALNMRIAASVVLLITSVVVAFYLVGPEQQKELATDLAPLDVESKATVATDAVAERAPAEPAQRVEVPEATVARQQTAAADASRRPAARRRDPVAPVLVADASAPDAAAPAEFRESRAAQPLRREAGGGVVGGVIGGAVSNEETAERRDPTRAMAEAASAAEAAPAAAPAPPPPPPARVTAAAPSIAADSAPRAATAQKTFAAEPRPDPVLGISIDPQAFERVRSAIEGGMTPPSTSIDVEALVNHFAGRPSRMPRGVRLEVEASPAPAESKGNVAILRFSVDTPADARGERESLAAATEAHIEIAIDDRVVTAIRPIGDGSISTSPSTIGYDTSVTRLYELDLRSSRLYASERVATVRLHYRTPSGRRRTIEEKIYARDLAKKWEQASRRQRLASLGALWAESLKGTNGAADVAVRASKLATENPTDPRARELAQISRASFQLRGGAGTGSGS